MFARIVASALAVLMSIGPSAARADKLTELSVQMDMPTKAELSWNDTFATSYRVTAEMNGHITIDEKVYGTKKTLTLVPDTNYVLSVCKYVDTDKANEIRINIRTPAAERYDLYDANIYNAYIAFVENAFGDFYDYKRTRVKSIGRYDLFKNMDTGYRYAIQLDILWEETEEDKVLANCVLVMRVPNGDAFAHAVSPHVFNGDWDTAYLCRMLNPWLYQYQSTEDFPSGTYRFEYYTDGLLLGEAEMRVK